MFPRAKNSGLTARLQLSVAAMALMVGAATAQTTPAKPAPEASAAIDEIVVTGFKTNDAASAMKSAVPVRDIPLTISGYSGDFMESIETTRIADLYNYMVGVQRAGGTGYDISIRGFSSGGADRNSLQIDGLPGLAVRFGSPPTINVQRVEVVKGPSSVLYGQVQPGGFVNIITKRPEAERSSAAEARFEAFYGAEAELSDTFGFALSADTTGAIDQNERFLYRLIGEVQDQDGFQARNFNKTYFFTPSLSAQVSDDTDVLATFEVRKENVGLYDGIVAFNNDIKGVARVTTRYQEPDDELKEVGYVGGLEVTHRFTDSVSWTTKIRDVYHEDRTIGAQNNAFRNATTLRRQDRDQLNKRQYFFLDTTLGYDVATGSVDHKLLVGFNGGRETSNFNRINFDSNNATFDINIANPVYGRIVKRAPVPDTWRISTFDSYGVYLQDQLTLTEQFKAVAALRYEWFDSLEEDGFGRGLPRSNKGNRVSPMLGLIYQPNEQVSLYSSFATSYNPPNPNAVDATGATFGDPETGRQVEAGAKIDFFDGKANATFSVFHITKRNVLQAAGGGISVLSGGERSKGLEFELSAQPMDNWKVVGGYAYVDAEVNRDRVPAQVGLRLRNAPVNTASIWTRYDLENESMSGLGFGFGVNYKSDRFGNLPAPAARLLLPSYTVADAVVYYTRDQFEATLKFGNVLSETYYESAISNIRITPGAPANIVFSIKGRF